MNFQILIIVYAHNGVTSSVAGFPTKPIAEAAVAQLSGLRHDGKHNIYVIRMYQ